MKGAGIVRASCAGTAVFTATAGLATVVPAADLAALAVALGLFVLGTVVFVVALWRAAARSRTEDIALGRLFFLDGAPRSVRALLLGSLAVEVVVALVTAGVRPNTSLAFGILAPMYAQALAALWGARYGEFAPRRAAQRSAPRGRSS